MPFKSKAQAKKFRVMEAEGEIPKGTSHRWAEHTPSIKKLPEHARKKKASWLDDLAASAADRAATVKLAAALDVAPDTVSALARACGTTPPLLAKVAFAAPESFRLVVKAAARGESTLLPLVFLAARVKAAGIASNDATLALTGGLSAPFATDTGNRTEAYGRGALMGIGGGVGANLGHGLGETMAQGGTGQKADLIRLLATLGGGAAGALGTRALLGQPSWKKKPAGEPEPRVKSAAAVVAAVLLTKLAGRFGGSKKHKAKKRRFGKRANAGCGPMPTVGRQSWSGPAAAGAGQMHVMG